MIQLIRGFKDILPEEIAVWQHIEKTARSLFADFGFKEIRLPILEHSELFKRSIGEDTDIVEKEMYTFSDGKRGMITLRPEATASVVRSYIQHKMYAKDPVQKLYTIGPMFRRERPQKGRYRQFYQIDAEVFGVNSPFIDAQIIFMLVTFFNRLSITDLETHINSLGCPECRPRFQKRLLGLITSVKSELCIDCEKRSTKNPLRVLDCKVPTCKKAMEDAPSILDFLCKDCDNHFEKVKALLDKRQVSFVVDKQLVRGLDYYTRTAFEIQTSLLGAQNAVAGGGRYDGLVKTLGGPAQPAIGFAIGFDRLVEIAGINKEDFISKPDIFIAALGEKCIDTAFEWVCTLNIKGVKCEMDFSGKSLKSLMKKADKLNAKHVLIVGEDELETRTVTLRNMSTKKQVSIETDSLVESIQEVLK